MLRFILIVLAIITGMGGFIVFSFLSNVKIQAKRVEAKRGAARQGIERLARSKKAASEMAKLPSANVSSNNEHSPGVESPEESLETTSEKEDSGYGRSLRELEKALKEEDMVVGNPIDMTILQGVDDYEYKPLVEDLKLGSKEFIEKFIERLGEVQKISNKGSQSRVLKIMELELFMLKREKFIHKDVADWARSEIKSVQAHLDRKPTSK